MSNLQRSIRADNAVIAGFPGVTFAVHICRGNSGGRGGAGWHREGSYDPIAEHLFGDLNFDRFLLEYDSELSGTFEALRHIQKGKMAVLGLVSNHGDVESREYLLRRLEEASQFVPMEQIGIAPGAASVRPTRSNGATAPDHQAARKSGASRQIAHGQHRVSPLTGKFIRESQPFPRLDGCVRMLAAMDRVRLVGDERPLIHQLHLVHLMKYRIWCYPAGIDQGEEGYG
jgi:hypothetical protein